MPYFGSKFHFWRLHWIVFWKCQMCFEETSLTANTQKHLFSNITTLLTDKYWQGQLTQTDSESSLVVNLVKTFLACSLITMQNLVVLSPTACAHVVGPKNLGAWATLSHKRGCGWPTRNMQLCNIVITPYLVALGQTVPAYVWDLKNFGDAGARPLGMGSGDALETCFSITCFTMPILAILGQTLRA